MSKLPIVSIMVAAGFSLLGCASQQIKPSDNILNEIRSGDYGTALDASSFAEIKDTVISGILNQIRGGMVDPESTYMMSVQTKEFDKCVLRNVTTTREAGTSSSKGYCVAFGYNSKNRMGGYGGAQPSVALVRIEKNGKLSIFAPTRALQDRELYKYPYTAETGVYSLSYLQ